MSDRSARVRPDGASLEDDERRRLPTLTRRAALSTSLAVGGALATAVRPPLARAATDGRDIRLHRFDSATAFLRGQGEGTRVVRDGIELAAPRETRTYVDPFAPVASPATFEVGTWTSPTLQSGFDLTQLVASWNATTPSGTWIEVGVRGRTPDGRRTDWFVLGRWCSEHPEQGGAIHRTSVDGQETEIATVWTDTLATVDDRTLRSVQLRVQLMRRPGTDVTPRVTLLTAMASALPTASSVPVSQPGPARGVVLPVPPLSQEVHAGHYPEWDNGGEAWCSPTSVSMIADFWRRGPSAADTAWVTVPPDPQVDHAARATYDHAYDGCGNWPFNPAYAATLGLRGFVTRLRSLREAEVLIAAGVPLVLSVSFDAGELDGAGYSTSGHLLVLCGFDAQGDPVCNDPASHLVPDNGQVRVTYRRDQLENVWLPHSGGLVYVLAPPDRRLPAAPDQPNW